MHEVRERILDEIYDKLGLNEPVERGGDGRGAGDITGGTGERRAALGGACGAGVLGSVVKGLLCGSHTLARGRSGFKASGTGG